MIDYEVYEVFITSFTGVAMKHRITVSLDEEVIAFYKQLTSRSGGSSFSKFVNDWLANTAPAAEHMTKQIALAQISPELALNELVLFQEQMRDQVQDVTGQIEALREASKSGQRLQLTPQTNRGVNPPSKPLGSGE